MNRTGVRPPGQTARTPVRCQGGSGAQGAEAADQTGFMGERMAPRIGDAFGAALLEYLEAVDRGPRWFDPGPGWHVVERDDGAVDANPAGPYFAPPEAWDTDLERRALDLARGRVLDIGAGAGRFALALVDRGHAVLALDVSPGAIEVCHRRGIATTHLGTVFDLPAGAGRFDTFLLAGNNLGLLESATHGPRFLQALRGLAAEDALVLGTGLDPFATDDPSHLAYHERNRRLGRLPGQIRLRTRHRDVATDWWDYLFQPPDDLAAMAEGTGFRLASVETDGALHLAALAAA